MYDNITVNSIVYLNDLLSGYFIYEVKRFGYFLFDNNMEVYKNYMWEVSGIQLRNNVNRYIKEGFGMCGQLFSLVRVLATFYDHKLEYVMGSIVGVNYYGLLDDDFYFFSGVNLESLLYKKSAPSTLLSNFFFLVNSFVFVVFVIFYVYKSTLFKPLISFINRFIVESEQNLFCLEDFLILVSIYITYFLYFGSLYVPIFGSTLLVFSVFKSLTFLIVFMVCFIPFYFLLQTGSYVFYYINGSGSGFNIFTLVLNDIMSVVSNILRYVIQSVRWFLFFFFYFALQLFMHEIKSDSILGDLSNHITNYSNGNILHSSISLPLYLVYSVIRLWFEVVDFLFIMVIQLSAFLVVLFWLFGFLFSTITPSIYEMTYFIGRNKNYV